MQKIVLNTEQSDKNLPRNSNNNGANSILFSNKKNFTSSGETGYSKYQNDDLESRKCIKQNSNKKFN